METKMFSINVDINNISIQDQVQPKGNLQANFFIMAEGKPYPSDPWWDFPVIVLSWWLEGFKTMIQTGISVENSFMNGPFEFGSQLVGDQVRLTFWKRTRSGNVEVRPSLDLTTEQYKSGLIQAANHLIGILDKYSITGADIKNLKLAFETVKVL